MKTLFSFLFVFMASLQLVAGQQPDTALLSKEILSLQERFAMGERKPGFLKTYLQKTDSLDIPTNQDVLDAYVSQLKVGDFDNLETVVFVMRQGPVIGSRGYSLARSNRLIIDSLYANLPLSLRKKINGRIIRNSFRQSVRKRNQRLARETASYVQDTWDKSNPFQGLLASERYMLSYYWNVRDTAQFLIRAKNFYDNYYMRMGPDSLGKIDFAEKNGVKNRRLPLDSALQKVYDKRPSRYDSLYVVRHAKSLNGAALSYFRLDSLNKDRLFDALRWSQRAVELAPDNASCRKTFGDVLNALGFDVQAKQEWDMAARLQHDETEKTIDPPVEELLD